jgi:CubicO group peptidase (beta-lactamase class C family)
MDRRHLLQILGMTATAAGLSPGQLAALMAPGARRHAGSAFFTTEQREAVAALSETIIPETDTPGAVEAGVVDFVELIVSEWMRPDERERFMRGLAHVDEHTEALTGVRFAHAGEATQTAVLSGLEAEGRVIMERDGDAPAPFFHHLRSLVLSGYYTSEIGMKQELLWQEIPGRFDGCVDLSEVTRQTVESG